MLNMIFDLLWLNGAVSVTNKKYLIIPLYKIVKTEGEKENVQRM